ncbi:MAG: FAD-dependent monooxygenase [Acidobacteria bacterium]|nr:FAD-dependent monooxygenase [Acidobacteriota bacterium]
MRETDVLIVGGGPAGLGAAIAARQNGLRVLVADSGLPPIDKACGEGLMPDSLAALSALGVDLSEYETGRFLGIRFHHNGATIEAEFPRGEGLGIRRLLLHQALVTRVEETGAECAWGVRVSRFAPGAALVQGEWVHYRWLVGADGNESRVRRWAGLDGGRRASKRLGLRQHFGVQPWSPYVEIYWAEHAQAYVTPVSAHEVCVAVISRDRERSFDLTLFPELASRLGGYSPTTPVRGALTWSRRLTHVARGNVALIGEASGSVDAITGEGLAIGFRQAAALGKALACSDLRGYEVAHRRIMARPTFSSKAMLLMDRYPWARRRVFAACHSHRDLFRRMLALHVGDESLLALNRNGILGVSAELLLA